MSAQAEIPVPLAATTTQVDIDLVDINGSRWVNAKAIITFMAAPHTQEPYLWNGAIFQMYYYYQDIGSAGHITVNLPSNLDIYPDGFNSLWRFDIFPNDDDKRAVTMSVLVATPAMDLSSSFSTASAIVIPLLVQSFPIPRAVNDSSVASVTNEGQLYFDSTMKLLKLWANGIWNTVETSADVPTIPYPPVGVPVSQGTAWGTSIDPTTLATTSQLNNFLPFTGGIMTASARIGFFNNSNYITAPNNQMLSLGGTSSVIISTGIYGQAVSFGSVAQFNVPAIAAADPTQPLGMATKQYVDNSIAGVPIGNYLPLTGGTVTGELIVDTDIALGGPKSADNPYMQSNSGVQFYFHANDDFRFDTTKNGQIFAIGYAAINAYVPTTINANLSITGTTTLSADPTTALQAATKQYVDNHFMPLAPSGAVTTDYDWNNLTFQGSAPAAIATSGTTAPNYFQLLGPTGQATTGTTGQVGGNGSSIIIQSGNGGAAPAGSTNGNGGTLYLAGGRSGQGAGTAGVGGDCYIQNNWGNTYIGGSSTGPHFEVAYGGVTTIYQNGTATLSVFNDTNATWLLNVGQSYNVTNPLQILFEVDTTQGTNGAGIIQPIRENVGWTDLHLCPNGGAVSCGSAVIANGALETTGTNASTTTGVGHISFTSDTTYIDSCGAAGNRGTFQFREFAAGGSSGIVVMQTDGSGNLSLAATFLNFGVGSAAGQSFGICSNFDGGWSSAFPYIRADSAGDIIINPKGSSAVYLCWDYGTGGTVFGNGSSAGVGYVDVSGNAHFNGNLSCGGTKPFIITHPLDDTKLLTHVCIEGPEAAVFYRGEAVTDDYGEAEITLPDYFEALTRLENRTVLVTAIYDDDGNYEEYGTVVASRVRNGKFKVRSTYAEQEFFWEVKAVRSDVEHVVVVKDKLERVH